MSKRSAISQTRLNSAPAIPDSKLRLLKYDIPSLEMLEQRLLLSVPTVWYNQGIGGTGTTYTPSISPQNSQEIYVGSDMGEVFHTSDWGANWDVPAAFPPGGVQYTSSASVMYSSGPKKSIDGGLTWAMLPCCTNPTYGQTFSDPNRTDRVIYSLVPSSTDSSLYISNDGGATQQTIFQHWNGSLYISGVFFDGNTAYIGTNNSGVWKGVYNGSTWTWTKPISGLPSGERIMSLAGAKTGSTVRLVILTLNSTQMTTDGRPFGYGLNPAYVAGYYKAIYTWDSGQTSWTKKVTGLTGGQRPTLVAMARNDINTIYASGSDIPDGSHYYGACIVYKSTNGGANWASVLTKANNANSTSASYGDGGDYDWSWSSVAGLGVDPNNSSRVTFTDQCDVRASTDGGATWNQIIVPASQATPAGQQITKNSFYGSSLNETSVWGLNWINANTVYAACTDAYGIRTISGSLDWSNPSSIKSGCITWQYPNWGTNWVNTTYKSVTAPNGTVYACTSSVHDLWNDGYQSDWGTENAGSGGNANWLLMSQDKGASFTVIHNFGQSNTAKSLCLDPSNPNRMYALIVNNSLGDGGVWVTNNLDQGAGATWTRLTNQPPRTEGHPEDMTILNDGTLVVWYSCRQAGGFTASSGVFISTDQGNSWIDRSGTDTSLEYFTRNVIIDPQDATQNTWYAAVYDSGRLEAGLYKTTNRGVNWTRILTTANDMVTSGANYAAINPVTHEMYVTTTEGLYYSADASVAVPTFVKGDELSVWNPHAGVFQPVQSGRSLDNDVRQRHLRWQFPGYVGRAGPAANSDQHIRGLHKGGPGLAEHGPVCPGLHRREFSRRHDRVDHGGHHQFRPGHDRCCHRPACRHGVLFPRSRVQPADSGHIQVLAVFQYDQRQDR